MVLSAPVLSFAGAMVINKNTEHPYASALFVDWTLSPDSQNLINSILRGPLTIKHPYLPETSSSSPIISSATTSPNGYTRPGTNRSAG